MNKEIKINYNWSCNQGIDIPEKHLEALEEDAEERIFPMIKNGYFSGELLTSVRFGKDQVPDEDEEEGLSYSGWFTVEFDDDSNFKKRYRNLEMEVMATLREMIDNSDLESKHISGKVIKVDLVDYTELAIINDRLTFLDKDGLQYSVFCDVSLDDLIDIINSCKP